MITKKMDTPEELFKKYNNPNESLAPDEERLLDRWMFEKNGKGLPRFRDKPGNPGKKPSNEAEKTQHTATIVTMDDGVGYNGGLVLDPEVIARNPNAK